MDELAVWVITWKQEKLQLLENPVGRPHRPNHGQSLQQSGQYYDKS